MIILKVQRHREIDLSYTGSLPSTHNSQAEVSWEPRMQSKSPTYAVGSGWAISYISYCLPECTLEVETELEPRHSDTGCGHPKQDLNHHANCPFLGLLEFATQTSSTVAWRHIPTGSV